MNTVRSPLPRSTTLNNFAGHPGSNNSAQWRTVISGFVESYRDACRLFYGITPHLLNTTCPSRAVR